MTFKNDEEITPEAIYHSRRKFIKESLIVSSSAVFSGFNPLKSVFANDSELQMTKEEYATSYNNFYEFSLEKEEVKKKVEKWTVDPNWKIEVSGLVENKKSYSLPELIELGGGLVDRTYRFRCVEGWSMVLPWKGFLLSKCIEKLKPKKEAKFVKFTSHSNKKDFPNLSLQPQYPWPYTEGLTIDEAQNPLTLIATGLYGKSLPKQNGAPLRLVTPWKYGFKNIKSIVKIEFVSDQPKTLWNTLAPNEYGFYANVNPQVDHPRWSQSTERILDGSFFPKRKPTLLFNGYEKEVASLYKGLDLKKNF